MAGVVAVGVVAATLARPANGSASRGGRDWGEFDLSVPADVATWDPGDCAFALVSEAGRMAFTPRAAELPGRIALGADGKARVRSWKVLGLAATFGSAGEEGTYQHLALGEIGFSLVGSPRHPKIWASTVAWELTTLGDTGFYGDFRSLSSFFPFYIHFTPHMELRTKMVHPYVEGDKWRIKDNRGNEWRVEEEGHYDTSRRVPMVVATSVIDVYAGGSGWADFGETSFMRFGVRAAKDFLTENSGFTMGVEGGVIVTPNEAGDANDTIPFFGVTVCLRMIGSK
jgi:hypothetical protein